MALGIMSAAKRNSRKNIEEWKVNLKLSLLNKIFGYPSQNVKSVETKLNLNKIYIKLTAEKTNGRFGHVGTRSPRPCL